eukprot:GHVR01144060.1.p1 GENE.GHVR01144060.1~~GHVR01144060.1.p1  ORF type:complete len:285 (+),score=52.17 GHVR01144060.1:432-1286(+)
MNKFYQSVLQTIIAHVDPHMVRCLLVAGPTFVPEEFVNFLKADSDGKPASYVPTILRNKKMIVTAHATSHHKHALNDLLSDPNVSSLLQNTKAASHVTTMELLYSRLSHDPDRACYGPNHVAFAVEHCAVDTLLVSDGLFRHSNIGQRKRFVKLTEDTKTSGGKVLVLSDMHVSGEQLRQLGGIAALLRYPLLELDGVGFEPLNEQYEDEDEATHTHTMRHLRAHTRIMTPVVVLCTYPRIYIHVYICIYIHMCVYLCIYIYTCVYECIYIYTVYTYIYSHEPT